MNGAAVVTVIVPVKNGAKTLPMLLERLRAQSAPFPFDVLAIDSGSTDGSPEVLAAAGVRLERIRPEDFGHGRTRNLGARLATGRYVAFLTQDALPANPAWLAELVAAAEISPRIAGVYGPHRAHAGATPFAKYAVEEYSAPVFGDRMRIDRIPEGGVPERSEELIRFLSNNNSLMRREVLLEIPFPDVEFGEDQAWTLEVLESGYWKVYTPRAIVEHSHDETPHGVFARAFDESRAYRRLFDVRLIPLSPIAVWRDARSYAEMLRASLERDPSLPGGERRAWLRRRYFFALARSVGHWLGTRASVDARPGVLELSRDVRRRGGLVGRLAPEEAVALGTGACPAVAVEVAGHGIPVPVHGWKSVRTYSVPHRRFVSGGLLDLNQRVSFSLDGFEARSFRVDLVRAEARGYEHVPMTLEIRVTARGREVFRSEHAIAPGRNLQTFTAEFPAGEPMDRVSLAAKAECSIFAYSDDERLFVAATLAGRHRQERGIAAAGGLFAKLGAVVASRSASIVLRRVRRRRQAKALAHVPRLVHLPPPRPEWPYDEFRVPLEQSTESLARLEAAALRSPPRGRPSLRWVVPPFGRGSGGHSNIIEYVKRLAERGFEQRISIFPAIAGAKDWNVEIDLERWFGLRGVPVENGIGDRPSDVLIATGWQTAYPVKLAAGGARKIYFVQDIETEFFPASSERLIVDGTYRLGLEHVTLGEWLAEELARRYGIVTRAVPFAYDAKVYFRSEAPRRREQVLVYHRPETPRRAARHIEAAVRRLAEADPSLTIVLFGSSVLDGFDGLARERRIVSVGVVSPRELNELYNVSACGVSISLSNPVLTHLEMMAAGCPVVDFDGAAARSLIRPGENGWLVPSTPADLVDGVLRIVRDPELARTLERGGLASVRGRDYSAGTDVWERFLTCRDHSVP